MNPSTTEYQNDFVKEGGVDCTATSSEEEQRIATEKTSDVFATDDSRGVPRRILQVESGRSC
jgi:hypothetical protein